MIFEIGFRDDQTKETSFPSCLRKGKKKKCTVPLDLPAKRLGGETLIDAWPLNVSCACKAGREGHRLLSPILLSRGRPPLSKIARGLDLVSIPIDSDPF